MINMLHDHGLIGKPLSTDARKIISYMFIQNLKLVLPVSNIVLYSTGNIDPNHEILQYYDAKQINSLIHKLCVKINRYTRKLFFTHKKPNMPHQRSFDELDGHIQDEIILLQSEAVDPKKLKRFLDSIKIDDIFSKYGGVHL